MKIKNLLLVGVIILLLAGCSVQSKLNRRFSGKSFSEVMLVKGAPTTIENLIGGGTIRSYVKKEMLRETPINTGRFQYDRFDSPKVLKSEITSFTVDQNGKVTEIKYSCEYSR
jgi:hypothetical protein